MKMGVGTGTSVGATLRATWIAWCALAAAGAVAAIALGGSAGASERIPAAAGGKVVPDLLDRSPRARHGLASLPPAMQSAISAALGAESRSFFARDARDGYRLQGGGVTAHLSTRGVTLRAGKASLSMKVAGIGRGERLSRPAVSSVGAKANRVSLVRDGVTEWYAAGPLGIEQGFTLSRRPAGDTGPVTLALGLGNGARAKRNAAGEVLLTRPGQPALRYGALSAVDANGKALRAALELRGRGLAIEVWDDGAAYPLLIDPLIQQGSKLVGGGASGLPSIGFEVALSADGHTALIGGPFDNDDVGAAWVFTRSGTTWSQQGAKLTGSGEAGQGLFGWAVSLSADGNTALIGAPGDDNRLGAAFVFTRTGASWSQQGGKLVGSGSISSDTFVAMGYGVALSGDGTTAFVGGAGDDSAKGAAWIFTRSGSTWTQQGSKLVGTNIVGDAYFGFGGTLSDDGNTAVIGGPFDNDLVGAAWFFVRSGGTWSQQGGKVTAVGESGAGFFGDSFGLSADGNTALIGASDDNNFIGAAWVYTRSGSTWSQQGGKLTPSGASGAGSFGYDVAITTDGNTALIGAPFDNNSLGAAFVFTRSGSTWSQSGSKLTAGGEAGAGTFGIAVALSADGDTALIGGPDDNDTLGAAWAFATPIPSAPTNVSAVAGLSSATVSFTGSSGARSYTVTSSPGGIQATGSASPIVVTGLTAEQAYTFTVTASNGTGTSPPSVASSSVTPYTTAGAPTAVSAAGGDGYATVSFTAPASDGGSAIQYYTVTAAPGGQSASGTGSPITVFGLANGVSYTFTVTATNAAGAGDASAPSNAVTPIGVSRPDTDPTPTPVPRPAVPEPPPARPRVPPP